MPCPKCAAPAADTDAVCPRCGLVFAKFDPAAQARVAAERRAARDAERRDAARLQRTLLVAGTLLLAAIVTVGWWSGRPAPQDFTAPDGDVFTGVAHEYAGPGAELILTSPEGDGPAIGRIGADGAFRFELPEIDLSIPVPPPPVFRDDAERAAYEARMAGLADVYDHPEVRMQRLAAGEGWTHLSVEPEHLEVGRYGIEYRGPGEAGALMAGNSAMKGVALPGDHVLTLVYADRDGTIHGTVIARNAFGMEVPNVWDVELKRGWNLVISEQTGNLARLRYYTGPIPDDLEWIAFDPATRKVSLD